MSIALISHSDCLLHEMGDSHPECPARLSTIKDALIRQNLDPLLQHYDAPLATREQILRAHDQTYVDTIFQIAPETGFIALDPDTSMNPHTLTAALRAAGAAIYAVDLVMANTVTSAFCNVRPPGHHAEHAKAMGFCFFNNLAIGVTHALTQYQLQRVAIVDFDVHHGNGTEDIFKDDNRVLFCSSFEHPFYPFTGAETVSDHILNIPLPAGTESNEFRSQVEKHWFAAIKDFKPELIFFSAGFDAHREDFLADLMLTEEDYFWLTKKINQIAQSCCHGRMISLLEGGYNLEALGRSAVAHIKGLL